MSKNKPLVLGLLAAVLLIASVLVYIFFFRTTSSAAINDECFDWKFPADIKIERYDPCSSLTLVKITDGREIKANFVLTKPIIGGGKDSFIGEPQEVSVDGGRVMRYLGDTRDSDSGLGNYHIDYSINYDRIPLKTEQSGGRTLLTAEFVLATKNSSHVSEQEIGDFVKLTDSVMAALHTK
jgi:hypothetical protein